MTNAPFGGIEDFEDLESVNHYRHAVEAGEDPDTVLEALRTMSRDNARTPMQWDDSAHAGFTTGTPWLSVNPNHREINAADAVADPFSVHAHYRRLIDLRHTVPVVAHGDFEMLLPEDPHVYAFLRRHEGVELLVVANFTGEARSADVKDADQWVQEELLLDNLERGAGAVAGPGIVLAPWEARVYRRVV